MTEQEKIDWIKTHCLDWMEEQGFKKKQCSAAAIAVLDVLKNLGVMRTTDTESGDPVLYISFGNYMEAIHGYAWKWDQTNQDWLELTIASSRRDDDTILVGDVPEL